MIRKTAAALIAGVALALAPTAAMAYVPTPTGGSTATLAPGGSAVFSFNGFEPGENVLFTLEGEGVGPGNLAGTTSVTKEADADGAAAATVTLPEDATGTYVLSAEGEASGDAGDITIDSGVSASAGGTGSSASGGALPGTGPADNTALVAGAAVLLVAGAGAVVVASRRRTDA
ncbi:LPXTG cell wall anchor domain-containing protein [Demequina sp. NBRC 110051]|uniref:LPXTG cell wall anchor domain-containing protein n=1 Tax=Demequina sp. NBRC 110051 TaxID=1570340 RepID=UPI0009FC432F|nr:LPXTG cell wall anchor domain-containing protein [Demequina sp. NBRC 110051]